MQINYIVYLIIQIRKTGSQIPRRFPVRHTPDHAKGLQKWNKTQQYEKGPPQAKVKPEKQTADSGRKKGKILGAQAIGHDGIDKRIDVIATIMRLGGSVADLRDAELCYAPPYSGAKDPINLIGMAIENARQGLVKPYFGTDFDNMLVLDVRPKAMYDKEHINGAINIPAAQIRQRLVELPKDKTIMIHCVKGYTSYVVARILSQNGFKNILSYAGGWTQYKNLSKK